MKHKIFADFTNADALGRLRVNLYGSKRDMEAMDVELFDGMPVVFYDGEEFEIEGTIEYSTIEHIWVGKIDWNALKSIHDL